MRRKPINNAKVQGRSMKKETHTAIKQQLIIAGKVLVAEGQDDFTRGHISVRVPGNPNMFSMKAYSQPGARFSGEVGVYTDTITLIRSHALGAGVAKALGGRRAVLLKNHGPVVTGKTIEEAVVSSIMLENAAQIQLMVEAAGTPAPEFR